MVCYGNRDYIGIRELESEFIRWNNQIEDDYLMYYEFLDDYSLDQLEKINDDYLFLLEEIQNKDERYRRLNGLGSINESHQDYLSLYDRLNLLLDIFDYEIDLRIGRIVDED